MRLHQGAEMDFLYGHSTFVAQTLYVVTRNPSSDCEPNLETVAQIVAEMLTVRNMVIKLPFFTFILFLHLF